METKRTTWQIESAQTDEAWTHDYVESIINRPALPPKEKYFGNVVVAWEELDPKVATVRSSGGTPEDRYLAEQIVWSDLESFGYEKAEFFLEAAVGRKLEKTADWNDIMAKAKRLIQSGNVTILRNGWNNIVAHVIGDHGEYQSEIGRDDPNSRAITTWTCECPWDQFAWQRTRQWKKYEGRPCAHVLATFWQGQATPLDADASGQTPPPGQRGPLPQTPADIGAGGGPGTPMPAAPEQQQAVPGMAPPGQPDILPPPPAAPQLFPPGSIPIGQPIPPGSTVSVPGARPQTPFDPMQQNHTYSRVSATEFQNGQMVRLEEPTYGIMEGKDEAHGSGQYKEIPLNSIGEVLGQDETTGWVDVAFAGPQGEAGPLEPYHVRAWIESEKLTPVNVPKPPGPFVRRHR